MKGLLLEADTENNGAISFNDFSKWWRDVVQSSEARPRPSHVAQPTRPLRRSLPKRPPLPRDGHK